MLDNTIYSDERSLRLFEGVTIASGATAESSVIPMNTFKPNGFLTLQLKTTGATLKAELLAGVNKVDADMVVPDGASDIVTAHTAGVGLFAIIPGMAISNLKVKLTASGGSVGVDGWLLIQ